MSFLLCAKTYLCVCSFETQNLYGDGFFLIPTPTKKAPDLQIPTSKLCIHEETMGGISKEWRSRLWAQPWEIALGAARRWLPLQSSPALHSVIRGDAGERLSQQHTRRIAVKNIVTSYMKHWGIVPSSREWSNRSQSRKSALASEDRKCNKRRAIVWAHKGGWWWLCSYSSS